MPTRARRSRSWHSPGARRNTCWMRPRRETCERLFACQVSVVRYQGKQKLRNVKVRFEARDQNAQTRNLKLETRNFILRPEAKERDHYVQESCEPPGCVANLGDGSSGRIRAAIDPAAGGRAGPPHGEAGESSFLCGQVSAEILLRSSIREPECALRCHPACR